MAYNTANVHRLRSFAEAKAWFEKVKPIRGNEDGVRPYGSRRHWGMASIAMPDEDTVELKYYNAPLVTWKSDDSFTVYAPKYYSAYAADHLHWYVPFDRGFFEWNKGRMFVSQNDGKKYHLPRTSTGLKFQKVGNKFFMLNKPVEYNIRKDRTAYKKAISAYAPFLEWAGIVLSINNKATGHELRMETENLIVEAGLPTEKQLRDFAHLSLANPNNTTLDDELRAQLWASVYALDRLPFRGIRSYGSYGGFNRPTCEVLNAWVTSDNPDLWAKALYVIGQRQNYIYSWQGNEAVVAIHELPVVKYVETLCQFIHRDTVFKKVRLDDGVVPSVTNGKYFEPEVVIVSKGIVDALSTNPNPVQ